MKSHGPNMPKTPGLRKQVSRPDYEDHLARPNLQRGSASVKNGNEFPFHYDIDKR